MISLIPKPVIVLLALNSHVKTEIIHELQGEFDFISINSRDYSFLTQIPTIDLLFINADLPEEKIRKIIKNLDNNQNLSEIPKIGISYKQNLGTSISEVKKYFNDYLVIPDALKILRTLINVWISTFNHVYLENQNKSVDQW